MPPTTTPSVSILFINTVVFGLIVFVIQKIISNSSDRKIADFKGLIDQQLLSYKNLYDQQLIQYKVEFDRQMEGYKSELKYLNDRLLALHTKRFEVVKEVNDRLVRLDSAMNALVRIRPTDPDKDEDAKIKQGLKTEAFEAYADYNNYILFNKIYFTEDFADKLEEIRKQYFTVQWDLNSSERFINMGLNEIDAHRESADAALKALSQIRQGIPQAISEVEKEFREMLGVA